MSAFSQDTDLRALPADVDMSDAINQYTFISMAAPENTVGNADGTGVATTYVSGSRPYGVLQNTCAPASAGKLAETVAAVRVRNVTKLRCGAAWKLGDSITGMDGGLGAPAGSGAEARGIAKSDAAVGDLAPVDLL